MKKFLKHAQTHIFRGFLAVIPLFLCYFAVRLIYILIDKNIMAFLSRFVEIRQIPGVGILLALLMLYLIGLIVSNIVGRQIFRFIENISERIPVIKPIYSVGKQLSYSLSMTSGEKKAFKKAVLVKFREDGIWTPGFVTGTMTDQKTNEELTLVFIPTAPNPTTGFVTVVKPNQIIDPGWTIEECVKVIVSAGLIAPKALKK